MENQKVKWNSEFFSLSELVKSSTANRLHIDNTPNDEVIRNLQYGTNMVLDPLRKLFGKPIIITSGFRCPQLNKVVGGVANSWHMQGNAADIRVDSQEDAKQKFELLKLLPSVDTCLFEHTKKSCWLHVQWNMSKTPRHHFNFNFVAL